MSPCLFRLPRRPLRCFFTAGWFIVIGSSVLEKAPVDTTRIAVPVVYDGSLLDSIAEVQTSPGMESDSPSSLSVGTRSLSLLPYVEVGSSPFCMSLIICRKLRAANLDLLDSLPNNADASFRSCSHRSRVAALSARNEPDKRSVLVSSRPDDTVAEVSCKAGLLNDVFSWPAAAHVSSLAHLRSLIFSRVSETRSCH